MSVKKKKKTRKLSDIFSQKHRGWEKSRAVPDPLGLGF